MWRVHAYLLTTKEFKFVEFTSKFMCVIFFVINHHLLVQSKSLCARSIVYTMYLCIWEFLFSFSHTFIYCVIYCNRRIVIVKNCHHSFLSMPSFLAIRMQTHLTWTIISWKWFFVGNRPNTVQLGIEYEMKYCVHVYYFMFITVCAGCKSSFLIYTLFNKNGA